MHQIIIATDSQTITLQHQAESRAVFADGAIAAAKYLVGKEPGLYTMDTMLADVL
jgi:4-hydroxy-tetrahydrodipicolinate reductase